MNAPTTLSTLTLATRTVSVLVCFASCGYSQVLYPVELPAELRATLKVDTTSKAPVNHLLFGLNCNWPEGLYGKTGYNNPEAQKLIRHFRPTSLRFPHGVWANFYDWESDGRRMTDNYKTPYDSAVKDHPDLKYGFAGFHSLHQELDFDVLFTWNVNYDSPEKGTRRLVDRRDKGFDVKWIELGNEIFWKTQRSEAVSDVEKYIRVSKAHAAALREVAPDVKIAMTPTAGRYESSQCPRSPHATAGAELASVGPFDKVRTSIMARLEACAVQRLPTAHMKTFVFAGHTVRRQHGRCAARLYERAASED